MAGTNSAYCTRPAEIAYREQNGRDPRKSHHTEMITVMVGICLGKEPLDRGLAQPKAVALEQAAEFVGREYAVSVLIRNLEEAMEVLLQLLQGEI